MCNALQMRELYPLQIFLQYDCRALQTGFSQPASTQSQTLRIHRHHSRVHTHLLIRRVIQQIYLALTTLVKWTMDATLTTIQLTRSSSLWIICLSSPRASPCSLFTQNTCASSSCQAHELLPPPPPPTRLCCFMWKTARSAS